MVVNGSFVTDKLEPNDVDCVLLIGPGFPADSAAEAELRAGLPFITLEMVGPAAFQPLTERTFATDRNLAVRHVEAKSAAMAEVGRSRSAKTRRLAAESASEAL